MRHLPDHRRLMLMEALLAGDSVKKAASRVGAGNEAVTHFLLDTGAACRAFQDRLVNGLAVDAVICQRVWGFSYVRRRNAYTPEINRGIPREGWVWVARDTATGLIVDWTVASGDALAADAFIASVRRRLAHPVALKARGRDIMLEKGNANGAESALLTRLYGLESPEEREEGNAAPTSVAGDFRRRCLNLELALSFHLACHNFMADAAKESPAVRLGLVPEGWTLQELAELA